MELWWGYAVAGVTCFLVALNWTMFAIDYLIPRLRLSTIVGVNLVILPVLACAAAAGCCVVKMVGSAHS